MFKQLLDLLKSPEPERVKADLRLSVAILMLEAADMDAAFSAEERAVIQELLTNRFTLSPSEAHELLSVSEQKIKTLVQIHPYTDTVFSQMSEDERIHLIEMLWEVVYADGVLDPEEDLLVRKVAGLIHVPDRERMLARQRVLARKGAT